MTDDNAVEKVKGKAKEAFGKVTDNDEMHEEGKAQQDKAEAKEEAEQAEAKQSSLD